MYRGNKTTSTIPTQRVLLHSLIHSSQCQYVTGLTSMNIITNSKPS